MFEDSPKNPYLKIARELSLVSVAAYFSDTGIPFSIFERASEEDKELIMLVYNLKSDKSLENNRLVKDIQRSADECHKNLMSESVDPFSDDTYLVLSQEYLNALKRLGGGKEY